LTPSSRIAPKVWLNPHRPQDLAVGQPVEGALPAVSELGDALRRVGAAAGDPVAAQGAAAAGHDHVDVDALALQHLHDAEGGDAAQATRPDDHGDPVTIAAQGCTGGVACSASTRRR
jgi:hypothetical protein